MDSRGLLPCLLLFSVCCAAGPRATNPLTGFLAPTPAIDADDPAIVARAAALVSGVRTDPDRVSAVTRFVREPGGRRPCVEDRASRLLDCGPRSSSQRVLLLAALARAAGIPVRLAAEQVSTVEAGGTPTLTMRLAADVYVGKRWQRVEVAPDEAAGEARRLPGVFSDVGGALREVLARDQLAGIGDYRDQIERWRAERERALRADDGWLTVVGLFWLKDGPNTVGAAPGSDVLLPAGGPDRAGTIRFDGRTARFEAAPGVVATAGRRPVTSLILRDESPSGPDMLELGSVRLFVIRRANRYAVRMRDTESPLRRAFTGLTWFPVDERLRIVARWEPATRPRQLSIVNVLGMVEDYESPGTAVFSLEGRTMRLDPIGRGENSGRLFFVFKDATAGRETYPAGRFLYTDAPRDGTVVLDFNRAENPPCAYTPHAACPLPPKQNVLPVRIEGGEAYTGHRRRD